MKNFLTLCLFLSVFLATTVSAEREKYIVYLGGHTHDLDDAADHRENVTNSHIQLLASVLGSEERARESLIYSYTAAINGFAARMKPVEATELSMKPEVVSVMRDRPVQLHRTRPWESLGEESAAGNVLPNSLWKKANLGEDMIVATMDTGVWPEAESFSDAGYGPIPPKWKGVCQNRTDTDGTRCNRKLIGARYFGKGCGEHPTVPHVFHSPRDSDGHGTETLSLAGGNTVSGDGAHGTLQGGAPKARVAAYKVCWPCGCHAIDVLAAFDAAIGDGVDVLSISLGDSSGSEHNDALAIGSFHAASKGISVVMSAGNEGPTEGTVENVAPWQLTVGASALSSKPARFIVDFSSRGPNVVAPEILKPDLIAPGVNLPTASVTKKPFLGGKSLRSTGTSYSCPRLAGIVALLKKVHPQWTPAAIKSALMTTGTHGDNMNQRNKNTSLVADATPFDYGAGHVVPSKAIDPGLIYDLRTQDYLNFFCAIGYSTSLVSKISGPDSYSCPSNPAPRVSDLNYPSIGMVNVSGSATTSRTLKNVGKPGTYTVRVHSPAGFDVTVTPTSLDFKEVGEEKKFKVTATMKGGAKRGYQFGWLVWSDGVHHVRSPIFVKAS